MTSPEFSIQSKEQVLVNLQATEKGLTSGQVHQRRHAFGWNELPEPKRKSLLIIFFIQFKSLLVGVLIVAAILSWITDHLVDASVISIVVLVQALIGFAQNVRAEKAIASLKKMIQPMAKVIRDNKKLALPARELVPGDVIELEEGDSIPADARILEAENVRTTEASLTGESTPVVKTADMLTEKRPIADCQNMVYCGTFLVSGYARAVVTAIGSATELGKIAESLREIKPVPSNFSRKINRLGTQMALASLVAACVLFLIGYFTTNMNLGELLLVAVAAMVAVVPEGLPAVVAIVLALGALRMSKRNAITREFTATETLGSISTIITDKTGTLTANALSVKKMLVVGEPLIEITGEGWSPAGNFIQHGLVVESFPQPAIQQFFRIAALSNNSSIHHNIEDNVYELAGDPTEGALLVLTRKAKLNFGLEARGARIMDLPFNSTDKLRATLVSNDKARELLAVGAPENILRSSSQFLGSAGPSAMTSEIRQNLEDRILEWSSQALRVVAIAYKEFGGSTISPADINNLVFVGLAGIIDLPRPEVQEAVGQCRRAGIRVVMATGDHINTAIAIARQVGIIDEKLRGEVPALSEEQLLGLDTEEFDEVIMKVNVFARLTAAMKLRIAQRLQAKGQLIAMTGDGVNDAPALSKADIGIAMGKMGTDVARDASKMVLADNNFSTIVHAIEEGRIVFNNARIATFYLVTTNFAEVITLIFAISLGLPIPLTAIQILWLNLVTDGLGDMALATERGHGDVLSQPPVRKNENILSPAIYPFLFISVFVTAGLSMVTYFHYLPEGVEQARSGAFLVMSFSQLFNMFNMRSLKRSVFQIGFFTNRYIAYAFVISALLTVGVLTVPSLRGLFGFAPIPYPEFLLLAATSALVLVFGELYKWFGGILAR